MMFAPQISTPSTCIPLGSPQPMTSINNDVAATVPQNIKEQIMKGEYIDLATLLSNDHNPNVQNLVLLKGELVVESPKSAVKILSIQQWSNVFIIYISVYCTAHPQRFQELLKYLYVIRQGALRCNNLGWKSYDEQFLGRDRYGVVAHVF